VNTNAHGWQPALPGLTLPGADPAAGSPLLDAARATIDALDGAGLLQARHTLGVQLVLTLAGSIDANLRRDGKVTVAISQAARQLQDALAALPEPVVDDEDPLALFLGERARIGREALT
jgi:hypothetical protein